MAEAPVHNTDRKKIVALLREAEIPVCEILRRLMAGEKYTVNAQKKLLMEWADAFGMGATEALNTAVRCGLLASARLPGPR